MAVKRQMTFEEKLKHSWWHWYDDAWRRLKKGETPNSLSSTQCACCEFKDFYDVPCKEKKSNCPISAISNKDYCDETPYRNIYSCTLKDAEMELMYFQLCYYWHGFRGEIWQ